MQKKYKRMLVFSGITLFSLFLDQITKYFVQIYIPLWNSVAVIKKFFYLTHVQNKGIVFGLFNDKIYMFIIVSILGLLIIFNLSKYFYDNVERMSALQIFSYAIILGGALGNSYDRFFRGFVIDFIDFSGIWSFIFNVADMNINIGAIALLIDSFWNEDRDKE